VICLWRGVISEENFVAFVKVHLGCMMVVLDCCYCCSFQILGAVDGLFAVVR